MPKPANIAKYIRIKAEKKIKLDNLEAKKNRFWFLILKFNLTAIYTKNLIYYFNRNLKYKKQKNIIKIKKILNHLKFIPKSVKVPKITKNIFYYNELFVYLKSLQKFRYTLMSRKRRRYFKKTKYKIINKIDRIFIFKKLIKQNLFRFSIFLFRKKFKKISKINIFDLFFIFRKRLINFYKRKQYILKINKKINNLYVTLLTGGGHVILSYSAGQVFRLNSKDSGDSDTFKRVVFSFNIPKKNRSKNKKYNQKTKIVEKDIKLKNRLRNKKRRRGINVLKQILQAFIKKLIILRILKIDFLEARGNSRKTIMLILKSLLKYGIEVEKYINFKARPHNNHKNIKFRKVKRK